MITVSYNYTVCCSKVSNQMCNPKILRGKSLWFHSPRPSSTTLGNAAQCNAAPPPTLILRQFNFRKLFCVFSGHNFLECWEKCRQGLFYGKLDWLFPHMWPYFGNWLYQSLPKVLYIFLIFIKNLLCLKFDHIGYHGY